MKKIIFVAFVLGWVSVRGQSTINGPTTVCPIVPSAYGTVSPSVYQASPSAPVGCFPDVSQAFFDWTITGGVYSNGDGTFTSNPKGTGMYVLPAVYWTQNTGPHSIQFVMSSVGCAPSAGATLSVTLIVPGSTPNTPAQLSVSPLVACPGDPVTLTASWDATHPDPNADASPNNNVVFLWEYSTTGPGGPFTSIVPSFYTTTNTYTYTIPTNTTASSLVFRVYTKYSPTYGCWANGQGSNLNSSGFVTATEPISSPRPPIPILGVCADGSSGSIYLKGLSGTPINGTVKYYLTSTALASAKGGLSIGDVIGSVDPTSSKGYQFYYDFGSPTNPLDGCPTSGSTPTGNDHTLSVSGVPNCAAGMNLTGVSNGTGPYMYKANGGSYGGSPNFIGLTAGNNTLAAIDKYGCVGSTTIQTYDVVSFTAPVIGLDCPGSTDNGTITLNASGGKAPLNYSVAGVNGGAYQSSNIFSSLTANNYTVTVKDSNGSGCTATTSVSVGNSSPIVVSSAAGQNPTCNGKNDGLINVVAGGGTGTLTYSSDASTFQSAASLTGLVAGTYSVTVKDGNTCTSTYSPVTLTDPAAISFSTLTETSQSCPEMTDGSINVEAGGGTGVLSYILTPPGGYTYSTTFNADGSTTYTDLKSGSYSIKVTDDNTCSSLQSVNVFLQSPLLANFFETASISCYGKADGELRVAGGGGTPGPYTYQWTTSSTPVSGDTYSGLTTGTYEVQVSDSKGCNKKFTQFIDQPDSLYITHTVSGYHGFEISCAGASNGSIDATVHGGSFPYAYVWSDGETQEDLSGLSPGGYTLAVTDKHGCVKVVNPISITEPAVTKLSFASQKNVSCNGGNDGMVTVSGAGGSGSYEYSLDSATWQSSPVFTLLTSGKYRVRLRDNNGCNDGLFSTITQPATLTLDLDSKTETSCGKSNGTANVLAGGGVTAYTYSWYNGATFLQNGASIGNLPSGNYTASVQDANSCLKTLTVLINDSDGPVISVDGADIKTTTCNESADGSVAISLAGGLTPYVIAWPGGENTTTVENLKGGDYTVSVRDQTGCQAFRTITIPSPPPILFTEVLQAPTCHGGTDGSIKINASGGNGAFTYTWSDGATGNARTTLEGGDYKVTMRDVKNCHLDHTVTLQDPPSLTMDLGPDRTICVGQKVNLIATAGTTFKWSSDNGFTSTSKQVVVSLPGTYRLDVTDAKGCQGSGTITIKTSTDLLKADFLMADEAFAGDTIVIIDISWPEPESINWNFSGGETLSLTGPYAEISYAEAGTYNVILQTHLGECLDELTKSITIKDNPNSGGRLPTSNAGLIKALSLYPNPTTGHFVVDVQLREPKDLQVDLVSIDGTRTFFTIEGTGKDIYQLGIDMTDFSTGIYYIIVHVGGSTKALRIVRM